MPAPRWTAVAPSRVRSWHLPDSSGPSTKTRRNARARRCRFPSLGTIGRPGRRVGHAFDDEPQGRVEQHANRDVDGSPHAAGKPVEEDAEVHVDECVDGAPPVHNLIGGRTLRDEPLAEPALEPPLERGAVAGETRMTGQLAPEMAALETVNKRQRAA